MCVSRAVTEGVGCGDAGSCHHIGSDMSAVIEQRVPRRPVLGPVSGLSDCSLPLEWRLCGLSVEKSSSPPLQPGLSTDLSHGVPSPLGRALMGPSRIPIPWPISIPLAHPQSLPGTTTSPVLKPVKLVC